MADMQPTALARLGSSTLAELLYRVACNSGGFPYQRPRILDVRQAGNDSPGSFTFAVNHFSMWQNQAFSP